MRGEKMTGRNDSRAEGVRKENRWKGGRDTCTYLQGLLTVLILNKEAKLIRFISNGCL